MPANVEATPTPPGLSPVYGKPIIARFDGGQLSWDGGVLALREIEQRLGIVDRLAACVDDPCIADRVMHRVRLPKFARVVAWKTRLMVNLRVVNFEELHAPLLDRCVAYARAHPHPELRDQTVWEVLEAERPCLVR